MNVDTKIDQAAYDILPSSKHQYDHDKLTTPISEKEIVSALKQSKKDSASKIYDISSSLLLLSSKATVTWMKLLVDQIWKRASTIRLEKSN